MGIPLARELTEHLVERRWSSARQMAEGWAKRVAGGIQKSGSARDAKTVYRWLAKGLPNDPDAIFGFAATLGVDPLALLDIESADFQKALYREWLTYLVNLQSRGKFSALWPLVRPATHWPPAAIAQDYYDAPWTVLTFAHPADPIASVYAQIRIADGPDEAEAARHRVYYFAYKRKGARDDLWRPYGIVRRRGREAICVGHNGDMGEAPGGGPLVLRIGEDGIIDVETFFGPGPTDFKVASLHPFTIDLCVPSRAAQCLRFTA